MWTNNKKHFYNLIFISFLRKNKIKRISYEKL